MNHTEIKAARQALGLSLSEFAEMLDTDPTTTRRLEMDPRLRHKYGEKKEAQEVEKDGFITVYPEVKR